MDISHNIRDRRKFLTKFVDPSFFRKIQILFKNGKEVNCQILDHSLIIWRKRVPRSISFLSWTLYTLNNTGEHEQYQCFSIHLLYTFFLELEQWFFLLIRLIIIIWMRHERLLLKKFMLLLLFLEERVLASAVIPSYRQKKKMKDLFRKQMFLYLFTCFTKKLFFERFQLTKKYFSVKRNCIVFCQSQISRI